MKKLISILFSSILLGTSCNTLDVPPINIIQDKDIFTSESGVTAYISSLYNDMPIQDLQQGNRTKISIKICFVA